MANPAYAQTVQPQTQEEIVANLQALMVQLMDMVAKLTVQLNEALAAQNAKLDTIQTQQTQSAPVLGSAPVAPALSVTLGAPLCYEKHVNGNTVQIPFTISGSAWQYGQVKAEPTVHPSNEVYGFSVFGKNTMGHNFNIRENSGQTSVTIQLGNERKAWNDNSPVPSFTFTDTVVIGDVCSN